MSAAKHGLDGIAIIGMAGRFPGARNLDQFWDNLRQGVESVSCFTDAELQAAGVAVPKDQTHFVKAGAILEGATDFDAKFFGLTPREAQITDPQHRLFLECAWEALEIAGYDPEQFAGSIGVFAGASMPTYLQANLWGHPDLWESLGAHALMLGNDKDFLPGRVSYKLNLRGPSLAIQTACSTSLVTVCVACQHLLNYQCDIALAGGVSLGFPQKRGYRYQEGGIASPDGHCRAFDARAAGTITGEGVGIVVLKRLADAVADHDSIDAVIKGFAVNNDGALKMGFSAPSIEGQAEVIATAQAMAGAAPDTISYVETHGTATPLGDPIEIAALTRAFRAGTTAKGFCAIGSVKTNIGHLDAAAGIAGLIKTALALRHAQLPASLHFEAPNPKIDFADSPFYVNTRLCEWKSGPAPRRAGVSSFGIGGTNAHVVLEEPPESEPPAPAAAPPRAQLLLLSARTDTALETAAANLAAHLRSHPHLDLADVAHTLRVGRRAFSHRRMLLARQTAEAIDALERRDRNRLLTATVSDSSRPVMFLFPGQGAQRVNMGRALYETEPVFRQEVDRGAALLEPHLGADLRTWIFPESDRGDEAEQMLAETFVTQPALFVIEHALARLWLSWDIRPQAMIGHSSGEYVAACLAGVFPFADALRLVARRGRLMQDLPRGAMLAVCLSEAELQTLLEPPLCLAAVNTTSRCVVSGPTDAIEAFQAKLTNRGIACRPLRTSHAFHSTMLEPMLAPFAQAFQDVPLRPPEIPCLSNVTGHWLTDAQATDPAYWTAQARQPVRLFDGLGVLLKEPEAILLEVGPGQTLASAAKQHPNRGRRHLVLGSLAAAEPATGDSDVLLNSLGQLWLAGARADWTAHGRGESRRRVRLPTYPFERHRHWIEPVNPAASPPTPDARTAQPEAAQAGGLPETTLADASHEPPRGLSSTRSDPARAAAWDKPRSDRDRFMVPMPAPSRMDASHEPDRGRAELPLSQATERMQAEARGYDRLHSILCNLSGLTAIDPTATFAELGVDSLFLTQASHEIERTFGVRVAFRQLFAELSTLEKLGRHLESALAARSAASDAATLRADSAGGSTATPAGPAAAPDPTAAAQATLPLTEGQREIWFATQMGENASCAFNESCLLHLRGTVHLPAIRGALQALVDRHEALRTTLSPTGDTQRVHRQLTLELPLSDLSAHAEPDRQRQRDALVAQAVQEPFDLVRGPLLRARLLRLAAAEHLLIVTVHHIICDGGALSMLLREWAALYSAAGGDQGPPPPAASFSEYVRRQIAREQSPDRAADEAYWLKHFAGELPAPNLPTDRPRPAARGFGGARQSGALDPALSQRLRQWSARQGATPFVTLLAAYSMLLGRLTGQDDLVIGIPTADRDLPASLTRVRKDGGAGLPPAGQVGPRGETLVGHCIQFLPLRLRLTGDPSFAAHLEAVKEVFFHALDHRYCGYGRLLRKLNLPHDPNRMPLVTATFTMDRLRESLSFSGLETTLLPNPHVLSPFDLAFTVLETGETLKLDARYRTDLFDAATVQRWVAHFETLLRAVLADPAQPLSRLPLLTAAERHQLLVQWNQTQSDYPRTACVHHLIQQQVARTPEAVALTFGHQSLTYRQLDQQANHLAARLRRRGVGPDARVGLCLPRGLDLVVALVGILKAGGAYVPLDPAYPKERLAWMLEDSQAALVLSQPDLAPSLPIQPDKILCLDHAAPPDEAACPPTAGPLADGGPDGARTRAVNAENLAYVIYTSGSTGRPKGVMVTHRNVVSFLHAMRAQPGIEAGDVLLAITTLSFDIAGLEIFLPLTVGAKVVLADREMASDAPRLAALLEASGATIMQATPSTWRLLVEAGWAGHPRLKLLCGGEALPRELATQLGGRGAGLWNLYGPTETTIWSSAQPVPPGTGIVPIGRPIANTQFYILDCHGQPAPVGVPGELFIGGDGVARGYWNQPELTREKFIPDPYRDQPDARLYRTGDRARYRPDGTVEFLGRADHQVKIRGHRIELGEIETVLARHPALRQAAVVARQDTPGDQRLVAYVVSATDPPPGIGALLDHVRQQLPDHMVPAAFVFLQHLPLTPNGKLDRRALPEPETTRPELSEAFRAPRTAIEISLAQIWREVLRLDRVGTQDNFFDLGGHSVLAAQVLARIQQAFGLELPLRVIFEHPTLAGLATVLDQTPRPAGDPPGGPTQRMPAAEAREWLGKVDHLSAAETDALLDALLAEEKR
ncbi:MAG: amino acid adenylation domain-containing protein [Verrucomicrobia bacterium]|nr:amino acid adenylation domain-containing protein [Verrucomicrobiota bacterium]